MTALAVGACFGLSGAIFQSMMRNPLASPDIIGITSGASAAAVIAILVLGLSGFAISAFAFGGALLTALAIYLLAWKQGVAGYRLVLVGIGIAAMLGAVIDYLMTRAQIWDAQVALLWLTGSLNGASAAELRPLLLVMLDRGAAGPAGPAARSGAAAGRRRGHQRRRPGGAVPRCS